MGLNKSIFLNFKTTAHGIQIFINGMYTYMNGTDSESESPFSQKVKEILMVWPPLGGGFVAVPLNS